MAGLKDIKRRLVSVKNTKKITYAMKLVAAAKLKKAQDAVLASRVYTDALSRLLSELSKEGGSEFRHPLMEQRTEVKNIRLIIVGGSRGLCGGYNTNLNKQTEATIRELSSRYPQAQIQSVILGKKPAEYFRRVKRSYLESFEELPEDANLWPVDDVCHQLEQAFLQGEVDETYLIYTKFRSAMSMRPTAEKILPMDAELSSTSSAESQVSEGVTLFEPSPQAVFNAIVPRILRTKVQQAGLDAKASEQGARMVAMDSATTNAGELIHGLTLKYNRLRQSAITSELLDIIGGAEAIN